MTTQNTIEAYFARLGLEPELAALYGALHEHGPQTISQLARQSGVERTRIYRLLPRLQETHLFEIERHYKRVILKAAPIGNAQVLVTRKEEEVKTLYEELSLLEKALAPVGLRSPTTRVQFYQGSEGVKQMLWNETKASSEVYCILYQNMQSKTNSAFFERWVRRCNERGMRFKGLIGSHFITTQQQWYASHSNERLRSWEARLVDEQVFPIEHSAVMYDDVVTYFNWQDNEVFGVEIYNRAVAEAQRRFFQLLWQASVPIDDVTGVRVPTGEGMR